jgi:hypothetical protein
MRQSPSPESQHPRTAMLVSTVVLTMAILAAAGAGAGRVWAQAPVTTQPVIPSGKISMEPLASRGGRLYSVIAGGLYFSTDGGSEWKRQSAASAPLVYPTCLANDPQNAQFVYMGTNYNSLFKSMDGGISFLRSSTGLGAGSQVAVTAIDLPALHPGILVAATAYWVGTSERTLVPQALYLSTNGGQSWFQVSDAVGETAISSLAVDSAAVVTAQSADGSTQRIPLDEELSKLMQYGSADTKSQVPVAMALLGLETGEVELNRRFWSGEDLPATVAALRLLGTPSTIMTLVSALADPKETTREHLSMRALETLREKAVPALVAALSDNNPVLRAKSAEMLGWIALASARPALELALTDVDQSVRVAAAWALTQIR